MSIELECGGSFRDHTSNLQHVGGGNIASRQKEKDDDVAMK